MSSFAEGEKVRVTFEGVVAASPNDEWVGVRLDDGLIHWVHADERVAKMERTVEVFGPGDTVRSKRTGRVWTLGLGGCLRHWNWMWANDPGARFTSEYFERVEVS